MAANGDLKNNAMIERDAISESWSNKYLPS
jgi:hypothetical protein